MLKQVGGVVTLARPMTVLANGAQVLLGAYLAQGGSALSNWSVVSAAMSMAMVTAVVNIVNDMRDVHADRLNRPSRPVVTGVVSLRTARWCAWGAAGCATVLAPAGLARIAIVGIMALSVAYSFGVKRIPLVANGYVAVLAGTPLVLGALVSGGGLRSAVVAAGVLSVFMFSYEVLKTLRDAEGDRHAGFSTVVTAWGAQVATAVYRLAVGAFAIVAALPLVVTPAGLPYSALMGGGVVMPSVMIALRIGSAPTPAIVLRALQVLVICWVPGLLALEDLR